VLLAITAAYASSQSVDATPRPRHRGTRIAGDHPRSRAARMRPPPALGDRTTAWSRRRAPAGRTHQQRPGL